MEPIRVLAVDDEPRGAQLVKRVLRKMADVELASSGDEAWALFQERPFDVVVSDQRMPGMTGVELLALVAKRAPNTGRILLTGYADSEDTIEAINAARVHAYLSKPCPADQLRLTVKNVLETTANERPAPHRQERGRRLIDGLRALSTDDASRLRAEQIVATFSADPGEPSTVATVLDQELAELILRAGRVGIDVESDIVPADAPLSHPAAFRWALRELFENAMAAMPGGGALRLSTRCGPSCEIRIEDAGGGWPGPVSIEPFAGEGNGIGLGLVLAEYAATLNQGDLRLEKSDLGGARASLLIPSVSADE